MYVSLCRNEGRSVKDIAVVDTYLRLIASDDLEGIGRSGAASYFSMHSGYLFVIGKSTENPSENAWLKDILLYTSM